MDDETLETPNKRKPRKEGEGAERRTGGGGTYATLSNSDWLKLMAESLKGAKDQDLADKFGVNVNTIRQRRYSDGAWRIAYDRLRESSLVESKNSVQTAKTSPLSIAEIASLNPELLANFTYNALKVAIDQGMIPIPTSWSEAKTAMEMMRKSTGQDDKNNVVQVNLWSGGGASPAPSVTVEAEIVSQQAREDWI